MPYSYATYTGNGSQTQYSVPFPYIRKEHVLAVVAGLPASFSWVNDSLIQFASAPANGAAIRVYRQTPLTNPLVDFVDGSTLVAEDLDINARQSIYTQQELSDSQTEGLANVIPNGNKGDITTSLNGATWLVNSGLAGTKVNPDFGSQNIQTTGSLSTGSLSTGSLSTGAGTFTGDVTLNAQSDLRFADSDSSNWVAFQAPATVAANVTWTLPGAEGTDGQKLSTNGSGVLSWTASVPNITYLTSPTSATYTPTTGTKAIYVEVVGAGGGGGGVDGQGAGTAALGGAGGGGAYVAKMITNMSQTFTYSVGTGGNGGAAGANNGSNGGTTTFIASVTGTLTASGGTGGSGVTAAAATDSGGGGVGGNTFTGGDLNLRGGSSTIGNTSSASFGIFSQAGCAPYFGTVGIANRSSNTNGANGGNPGEGGAGGGVSATTTNYAGGNGANGVIRITEFF